MSATTTDIKTDIRSIEMNCLNEALARERMRQAHVRARDASLARELAAARRWRRVSSYAGAVERRHTALAREAAASAAAR